MAIYVANNGQLQTIKGIYYGMTEDYINATLFHNIVLTSATEIWFAFYDQSPDLSGYSFAGYCDNNNRIEVYKNRTKYILVNPQNNDMYAPISCYRFLYNYTSLVTCNIENFNTQNVTNMQQMFYNCSSLTSLDLSSFNTQNVTNMIAIFQHCNYLTNLNISNFNTSKLTNISFFFNGCANLTILDLRHFDTTKVTDMGFMFQNCNKLTKLYLNFSTANVTTMAYMLHNCSMLQLIESNSFIRNASLNSSYMFYNCTSLVGGNGTHYSAAHVNAEYARVDGENGLAGYFTAQN